MRITLTNNCRININKFSVAGLHLINGYGNTMWYFFIQGAKRLLTDQFCHDLSLRLIGYGILIVKLRAIRQIFHNRIDQVFCIVAFKSRARYDFRKITDIFVGIDTLENLFSFDCVNLVDNKDDRCLCLP